MSEPSAATGAGERPSVLTVATLTKVHGIRGELKLRCSAEILAFLRDAAEEALPVTLLLPATGDEYEVTLASVRGHESAPIVAIDGVEDRSSAEEYRGAEVRVARELLPEPEEDEYFLADLAGCAVHDHVSGERIGIVERAESMPANVVLTVALEGRREALLVPLVDDAVPAIDVAARRMDIDVAFLGIDAADEERDA